jgi:hypothetical protein
MKQTLRTSGRPSALNRIVTGYVIFSLRFPFSGISRLNSLISPGARGSCGTVAQEEIVSKIAALVRIEVKTLFISLSLR